MKIKTNNKCLHKNMTKIDNKQIKKIKQSNIL